MKAWKKLYGINGKFICPYCLQEFPIEQATKDHKNPKSRFKDYSPENITVCCEKCNNQKGALTAEEYELWKILEYIRNGGLTRGQ